MIQYILSVKNDLSRDMQSFLSTVLNDFLMRKETHNILIDIDADLILYKTITPFNKARILRAAFNYIRETEASHDAVSAE